MKKCRTGFLTVTIAIGGAIVCLAQNPEPSDAVTTAPDFEEQFTIDSEFGVFQADGNEMLLQRVKEIYMIAKLKDVSRTDQFEQSLVTAAKGRARHFRENDIRLANWLLKLACYPLRLSLWPSSIL